MNEHRQCKYQYQTEYVAHDPKLGVHQFTIISDIRAPHSQMQAQIEVNVRLRSQRRIKI